MNHWGRVVCAGLLVILLTGCAEPPPRYQITEVQGLIVRLDTKTGEMRIGMIGDPARPPDRRVIIYDLTQK